CLADSSAQCCGMRWDAEACSAHQCNDVAAAGPRRCQCFGADICCPGLGCAGTASSP
ncbi:unnamed protein product, partial [Symbiodinium necroappetens]